MGKFCKNCGAQLADNARFCAGCGAPVSGYPMYFDQGSEAGKKKKRVPVFVIIYLALVAVFLGVVAFFVIRYANKNEPLHGAKVKSRVIWETGDLKVTVKGLYYDSNDREAPHYITLEAVNSGASEKVLGVEASAVNTVMVDSALELPVPPGGKAKGDLHFSGRALDSYASLSEFFSIAFLLREDDLTSDVILLNTGLKEHPIYINTGEDDPQYEENGIVVNYSTVYPSFSNYGPGLEFYVENNTDRYICVRSRDAAVKGNAVESKGSDGAFLPHSLGYVWLQLGTKELEEKDLLPVRDVTAEFEFYDPKTQEILATVPVNVEMP